MSWTGPRGAPSLPAARVPGVLEIPGGAQEMSVAVEGMSDSTFPSHCRAVQPILHGWVGCSAPVSGPLAPLPAITFSGCFTSH